MSEALVAELGRRVDMGVPVSILRELGSQEYQAKLLEAQAKVGPPSPANPLPTGLIRGAGMLSRTFYNACCWRRRPRCPRPLQAFPLAEVKPLERLAV